MASGNKKHDALLDELLKDYTDPQDILGEHGILRQLTKRLVERALEAEFDCTPRVCTARAQREEPW